MAPQGQLARIQGAALGGGVGLGDLRHSTPGAAKRAGGRGHRREAGGQAQLFSRGCSSKASCCRPRAAPCAVLATNTSSISVTAIANGLQHPGRLVGMHFFNPVPLMKLVEVVSGLHTDAPVAEAIFEAEPGLGQDAGAREEHAGLHRQPHRAALLRRDAGAAAGTGRHAGRCWTPACAQRASAWGPCELMDLIGHDTNFAVTNSVYEANFHDKRYQPSLVQREMVDGGLLGRKSGRGFYPTRARPALPVAVHEAPANAGEVTVHGEGTDGRTPGARRRARAGRRRAGARRACAAAAGPAWRSTARGCVLTDGRTAPNCADWAWPTWPCSTARCCCPRTGQALAFAVRRRRRSLAHQGAAWLAALGFAPLPWPTRRAWWSRARGHADQRSRRRRAAGRVQPDGADAAMKLGVNYPAGPLRVAGPLDGVAGVVQPCWRRWTTTTAANATASAPGCAAACTARGSLMTLKPSSATPSAPPSAATAARCRRCARRPGRHPDPGADAAQPGVDWAALDDVLYGCANQAGEDNRNVARMSLLLAGLPQKCPAPRSTACAGRAWTRWAARRAPSRAARCS
jgi:hypothetical protein